MNQGSTFTESSFFNEMVKTNVVNSFRECKKIIELPFLKGDSNVKK